MDETYPVKIITPSEKDELLDKIISRKLYDKKASIHGMCIELITDEKEFKESWEDNFRSMGDEVRPHGRVVAVNSPDEKDKNEIQKDFVSNSDEFKNKAYYEPVSKTSFLLNCDYYGYVKSFALAVAADFLEDYHSIHKRFSIHGSCIDFDGRGMVLIAPSGTGKTTHSFGLLLKKSASLVADDWIFVKLVPKPLAYASEKNCYIRKDIGDDFQVFKKLVDSTKLDSKKRGMADIEDVIGHNKRRHSTIVRVVMIMKRDKEDTSIIREISTDEAISYLSRHNFCNPYQFVNDARKIRMRTDFFRKFLDTTKVYMLNTISTIEETQKEIRKIADTL